jgi:mono/diheme cytochrome c family protein
VQTVSQCHHSERVCDSADLRHETCAPDWNADRTKPKLRRKLTMIFHSNLLVARALSTLALASLILTAMSADVRAEESEDAVYPEEQAVTGRDLYAEHCAFCHGMMLEGRSSVPMSGATFQARWADEKHSVGDLFYIVRTLMPYGQPATLSKPEYIDIIAHLLMMNGYPAGARALPLDPAVLDSIIIKPRRP